MTEKVQQMTEQLGGLKDPFDQNQIFALLFSRIAAGLESSEPEAKFLIEPSSDGPAWQAANDHLAKMEEINPQKTLEVAVDIALCPKSIDPNQERVNQWVRTTGLSYLGEGRNAIHLDEYLEDGTRKAEIEEALLGNINTNIFVLEVPADYANPHGFTTTQSVYIGLGLRHAESEAGGRIYRAARKRRTDPDITNAAEIISAFPGCEYISGRFFPKD